MARPKSDWAVPDRLGGLSIDGDVADGAGSGHVLLANEAERIVEGLKRFKLVDVGSSAWMAQHADIEKLNQQAHASARDKMDEFVLEALITFEKIDLLIYDLVLIEAWREGVFPLLFDELAGDSKRSSAMRCYFVLYHEATVVNLLEVVCYHAHALAAAKDATLDLLDYCARRLAALHAKADEFRESALARHDPGQSAKEVAERLEQRSASDELRCHARDIEFRASVSCVALVRFVCEHIGELSVSAMSRLLSTHDLMLSVVPLIENPPWTRMRRDASTQTRAWEKIVEGAWARLSPDRLLEVTKIEAQAWLALYHLAMHPEVRKRYGFDAYRKQSLLRARRFINDVLLDQLPLLADLQRFMDELAIVDTPEPTALAQSSHLLMEQVAAQRDLVLRGVKFEDVAAQQRATVWSDENQEEADRSLAQLVDIYAGDDGDEPDTLDLDKLQADLAAAAVEAPGRFEVRIVEQRSGAACFATPSEVPGKAVSTDGGPFYRERWACAGGIDVDCDSGDLRVDVALGGEPVTLAARDAEPLARASDEQPKNKVWWQFGSVETGLAVQLQLVLQPGAAAPPRYRVADVVYVSRAATK
ncbi:hypothetical protein M885DRAFT_472257 [Pelagophyceae sp. CCMP2097]|nr:hypothetical protein M885DRAFT_472257 [Pelagophyceae sp. CCMP2097]